MILTAPIRKMIGRTARIDRRSVLFVLVSLVSLVSGLCIVSAASAGAEGDSKTVSVPRPDGEEQAFPHSDLPSVNAKGPDSLETIRRPISALYLPPANSTPQGVRLVGAGTRYRGGLPRQVPLAPDHVGLTEQDQPTLQWYSTGRAEIRVDFVLLDVESGNTVLQKTLGTSIDEGYQSVSLVDHDVVLQLDVTYRWFVILIPDPDNRATDVISAAGLRRVQASGDALDWVSLAGRSIWYDALASASQGAASIGASNAARSKLLASVGLDISTR